MSDLFTWLQKLSQIEDSGIEVFIDEDGEIEFEIEQEIFLKLIQDYADEPKDE